MSYVLTSRFAGLGEAFTWTGPCGFFNGGVFRKECWCLDYPGLCSREDYQAAVGVVHPEMLYSGGLRPVGGAPPAINAGNLAPTPADPCAGYSGTDYAACTAGVAPSLVADEERAQQIRNQQYFAGVADNIDAAGAAYDTATGAGGLSLSAWLAIGVVGVLAVAAAGGGSPRRYGR